ncbi:MAG: hypothetical protein E3K32_09405 [wastewater metagenome]|nr:hypothetical protein [Candidatus Loosdrechtia aerotolerans]
MIKIKVHSISSRLLCFMVLFITGIGCAPVISKQTRQQVNPDLTFLEVLKDPERYKGQTIILSGIVLEAKNTDEGTVLEILQTQADYRGEPEDIDRSRGRFLARYDGYLDTSVYERGRGVTIAGTIEGTRIQPLGEVEYIYPFIHVKEIYLWPARRMYPYPYSYYDRYHWWRSPFYYHRHRHFPRRKLDREDSKKQEIGIGKGERREFRQRKSDKSRKK